MKLNWFFEPQMTLNTLDIHLHPDNKAIVPQLELLVGSELKLAVIEPMTNRRSQLAITEVLSIEAMDHLSKVYTIDQQVVYIKGRLKEFIKWSDLGLMRINNTTILNVKQIVSFQVERNACLTVYTKQGQLFRVSRHYAKVIRQHLMSV